ncbi:MAG: DGQHR domain-containing protein [Nitrospirae bacterium]|nr:DGQHR domain-containing protein [Nitrospirota bacterium]
MANKIKTKVLSFSQGHHKLVFFCLDASHIWNNFAINRRVEDKDEGYQRTLSPSRVKKIAKYVSGGNTLPLSILVSLEKGKYRLENDFILLNNEPDIGWIIDGQHRVAGAHESKAKVILPVIAFLELNPEEQIRQFVTINKEAKGVPTSLYYDLLKHLPIGTPSERAKERAVDIADTLKQDEESSFFGRIVSITSPQKGELSLATFTKKIAPLVFENRGFLASYSMNEQVKIIDNYYKALKNTFPKYYKDDDSVFFKTTGFGALIRVLTTVFSYCLKIKKGFTVAEIGDILNEVNHFNFDNWKKIGTGNAAEIQAADDLRTELEESLSTESDESRIRL